MAKRPLRAWMREKLLNHAKEAVAPSAESKTLNSSYLRAVPLVRAIIEKKYPARVMRVLKKYNCTSGNDDFKIQSPSGAVTLFTFEAQDLPLTPSGLGYKPIFLGDERTFAAVEAWIAAKDAYAKERERRIEAFRAVTNSAAYVEDVFEVWPEAAKLIPATALSTTISPEQIAIIKTDMRERRAV